MKVLVNIIDKLEEKAFDIEVRMKINERNNLIEGFENLFCEYF